MASFRGDRINEEVRREVDEIVRADIRDPRVEGTFSITHVEVTRDLRYAKVHVSVLEEEKRDGLVKALRGAAGYIRRELGKRMQLRYIPELLFEPDTNIAYADHINRLLRRVQPEAAEGSEKDEEMRDDG